MIFAQPSDVGFGCVNRRRGFAILVRRDSGCFVRNPQEIYDAICKELKTRQLYLLNGLWASFDMVQQEQQMLVSGSKSRAGTKSKFLSPFEEKNRELYETILDRERPGEDHNLQCFIPGQNPTRCFKASRNGVLPAFTATDKIMYCRGRRGLVTAMEKFGVHSYPVTEELADVLKVPVAWSERSFKHGTCLIRFCVFPVGSSYLFLMFPGSRRTENT